VDHRPPSTHPTAGAEPRPSRAGRRVAFALARPLLVVSDAAIIAATFLLCYHLRFTWQVLPPAAAPPDYGPYIHASVLVAIAWTACLAWVGLYRPRRAPSRFDDLALLAMGLATGAGATLALSFFYRSFSYSRLVAAYALLGGFVALGAWHLLLRTLQGAAIARGAFARGTLVLGANPLAAEVAGRLLDRPRLGFALRGAVRLPGDPPGFAMPVPVIGEEADLPALLPGHAVDAVIVAWPDAPVAKLVGLIQAIGAMREGLDVLVAPDLSELMTARLETTTLDGMPMLAIREVALRKPRNRAIKRAMDVALAGAGLLAVAPALGAIALAVRLDSPGPALYAQERLGRDGHPFTIYKFRTMAPDAEPDGPIWTKVGDDRATRLGAFLRRYSLDELPQLWNVLKGDMSLVGPRPERPHFVESFRTHVPKYDDRHLVRCGLTGWAQINGLRGDVSIEARTKYDIWYVENWTVLLDVRIMLKTAAEIFRRPAY
jgi:exopolysaccharide biosynthesis polyprenyl glycosylphosphotransferase